MKTIKNILRGFIYETAYTIIDVAEIVVDWIATHDGIQSVRCSTCLQDIQK